MQGAWFVNGDNEETSDGLGEDSLQAPSNDNDEDEEEEFLTRLLAAGVSLAVALKPSKSLYYLLMPIFVGGGRCPSTIEGAVFVARFQTLSGNAVFKRKSKAITLIFCLRISCNSNSNVQFLQQRQHQILRQTDN